MVELMKQIVEAWSERLRSPFLGSIALSFVVINWKVLFYLFFADEPVHARILYFEENTSRDCLVWYPLAFGISFALLSPWLTLIGAWFARKPKDWIHYLQDDASRDRRIREYSRKAEEEAAMAKYEAEQEQRKIDRAKRLDEAKKVDDAGLEEEIRSDREKRDTSNGTSAIDELDDFQKLVIADLAVQDVGPKRVSEIIEGSKFSEQARRLNENLNTQRLKVDTQAALNSLKRLKLVYEPTLSRWSLTSEGYAVSDELRDELNA